MKKILLILFTILMAGNYSAQFRKKSYRHIMKSKSIYEIDAFLKVAHEDDPRREILKPRLIKIMKEYIRKAHPADPRIKEMQKKIALLNTRNSTKITYEEMSEEIQRKKIEEYKAKLQAKQQNAYTNEDSGKEDGINQSNETNQSEENSYASSKTNSATEKEFKRLMSRNSKEEEDKKINLLNKLFENDSSSKEAVVMIENKSDCNIVITMEGAGNTLYKLPIPAHEENSIVIEKGSYLFSGNVCDAVYSSQKTVSKSVMIALKNPS